MVPITSERSAGSLTYGNAYDDRSAQPYNVSDDWVVRSTMPLRPPSPFIQSSCSAIRNSVATDGVL